MNYVISSHELMPWRSVVISTPSSVRALMDATDTLSNGFHTVHPWVLSTQLLNLRCRELNDDSSTNMNLHPCDNSTLMVALNTCQLSTTSDQVEWRGLTDGFRHAMFMRSLSSHRSFSRLGNTSPGCCNRIRPSSSLMVTGHPFMVVRACSTISHHLSSRAYHSRCRCHLASSWDGSFMT